MRRSMHFGSLIVSTLIGTGLVFGLSIISASAFGAPPFPLLAILSGFLATGFLGGVISKENTILEPGIAAVIVGVLIATIVPSLQLKGFINLTGADYWLIASNGVIMSFIGAWAGEQVQGNHAGKADTSSLEWSWILSGAVIGVMLSMILSSSLVILIDSTYGLKYHLIAFLLGLFIVGFLVGWRSPGITIRESALAGYLTVIIDLDAIVMGIGVSSAELLYDLLIYGSIIGIVVSLVGGFVGEKFQSRK